MAGYCLGAAMALAATLIGPGASESAPHKLASGDLQWRQMIPEVSFAPSHGDWEKGAHGKFVRITRAARIPLHIHSNDYHAVFIAGRMANLFDKGEREEIGPGDYFYMAAKRPHSHECLTEEPCFFYTYGSGHWDLELHKVD